MDRKGRQQIGVVYTKSMAFCGLVNIHAERLSADCKCAHRAQNVEFFVAIPTELSPTIFHNSMAGI
jgi:hypothetical protein